ncbi:hypothetical protein C8J57DRAFT_1399054, partial [Mycena rebaudengoi]
MVFGRTAMSRRLLFRYILIFSSFFAEIRLVLPSISEKVSIPLSPDSASFLLRHSKALPCHHLCLSQHSRPAMVIPTPYFDSTAPPKVILLPTLDIGPTEIPGNLRGRHVSYHIFLSQGVRIASAGAGVSAAS